MCNWIYRQYHDLCQTYWYCSHIESEIPIEIGRNLFFFIETINAFSFHWRIVQRCHYGKHWFFFHECYLRKWYNEQKRHNRITFEWHGMIVKRGNNTIKSHLSTPIGGGRTPDCNRCRWKSSDQTLVNDNSFSSFCWAFN